MRFKKQTGKKIESARRASAQMPLLRHSIPGEEFDIMKSEACNWLLSQPEIRSWVWEKMKDNLSISYDEKFKMWEGDGIGD